MTDHHSHELDYIGDRRVPPRVVTVAENLVGINRGSVCVHSGASLDVLGTQQGSLTFREASAGRISGTVQGPLHVHSGAAVEIAGAQQGPVHLDPGAQVSVLPGGKLAGPLHNDGLVINRGTRGGPYTGTEEIQDVDGGTEKQPIVRDGVQYYEW